jgi:hypothetical protein
VEQATAEVMLRTLHEHVSTQRTGDIAPLIHPEAEMHLLVSHGRLLRGRDAIVDSLQHGRAAELYRAQVIGFEWLDEHTSLTSATARYALERGGFAEGTVYWLDEFRDNLVWRVQVFSTEQEARERYAARRNGQGVPDPP